MPRLEDDFSSLTLDVHGATVDQAVALIRRAVRMAADRGRSHVRVIHGASTSDADGRNRTIKHALESMLAEGSLHGATGALSTGGATILGLPLGRPRDARRITLADIW